MKDSAFVRVTQIVETLSSAEDAISLPAGTNSLHAYHDYEVVSRDPETHRWLCVDEVLKFFLARDLLREAADFELSYFPSREELREELFASRQREVATLNDVGYWNMVTEHLGLCPVCQCLLSHDATEPMVTCGCPSAQSWTGRWPVIADIKEHILRAMSCLSQSHGARKYLEQAMRINACIPEVDPFGHNGTSEDSPEKETPRIVAVMSAGDWSDARVCHLAIPPSMDLDVEKERWLRWYHTIYCPSLRTSERVAYIHYTDWLKKEGALDATEIEEFWP